MAKKGAPRNGKLMSKVSAAVSTAMAEKPIEGEVIPLPRISKPEEKFAGHYAVFANGAAAVKFAGFEIADESAYNTAYRLLRRGDIQAHITHAREKLGDLHFDASERIMQKLDSMMEADITAAFDANGNITDPLTWPDGLKLLLVGIEVEEEFTTEGDERGMIRTKKVKFDSRRSVMELMSKLLGNIRGGGEGDGNGSGMTWNVTVNNIIGEIPKKS